MEQKYERFSKGVTSNNLGAVKWNGSSCLTIMAVSHDSECENKCALARAPVLCVWAL